MFILFICLIILSMHSYIHDTTHYIKNAFHYFNFVSKIYFYICMQCGIVWRSILNKITILKRVCVCSFLWKYKSLHRKAKYFICQKNLPHQPHAQPATFYMLTHLSLSHCTIKLLIFTLFFPIGRKGNEHVQSTTCRRKRGPRLTSLQPTKHRNTPKGYPILPVVVRAEVSRNPVPFWHFCREKG